MSSEIRDTSSIVLTDEKRRWFEGEVVEFNLGINREGDAWVMRTMTSGGKPGSYPIKINLDTGIGIEIFDPEITDETLAFLRGLSGWEPPVSG